MKEKAEDVIHTSAYAEAQNAGKMGADSVESFAARQAMEANRTVVGAYKASKVGSGTYNRWERAKVYDGGGGGGATGAGGASGTSGTSAKEAYMARREALANRFGGVPSGNGAGGRGLGGSGQPPVRRNPGIVR